MKKEMGGLKKFVLLVLAVIAAVFMAILIVLATGGPAHAERKVSLKDGVLTVSAEVMRVRGIPKEISDPELALKFITGQLNEAVIKDNDGLVSYSLFPLVNTKYKYSDKVVTYYGGAWLVTQMPNRIKEYPEYAFTLFVWIIIMAIVVVAVNDIAKIVGLRRNGYRKVDE